MQANKYSLHILLWAVIVLSGCAIKTSNYMPANLPDNSLAIIAHDISPIIAEHNPAKSISFTLHRDDFGRHLANDLGQLGYEVMFIGQNEQQPENQEEIRYTIDWADPESVYIALTINNRQRYTRSYNVDQSTLVANKSKLIGVFDD
ncbi:MAG: hypothetical protein MUO63_10600 [Desulfobulbaceae bacterium]|nr:hypothetical protein [Desulfobulbaceae bacterium]